MVHVTPIPSRFAFCSPGRRERGRPTRSVRGAALLATALGVLVGPVPALGQEGHGHQGGHAQHGDDVPADAGARLEMDHRPEEGVIVLRLGPFALPAGGNTMRLSPARVMTVPVEGWLTSFETRVLDDEGRELPSDILHHINLVRPDRRELFMPVMQRLAAAGQETGRVRVPFPFGIPVIPGDTVLVVAMVHNPTGGPVDATVEARIRYDTPAWLDRIGVQPFHMDIHPPPAGASFDLPPGRSTFTWEGSPAIDVKVLGLGGHIHEYGEELRLEELRADGTARVLWRSTPEKREDGGVAAVPRKTFLLRLGLLLSSDRTYRLVAVYHNPTDRVIPAGGMAEIAGAVVPRDDWPASDPGDATFRADYRSFTRHSPELRMASGHR
jgi:hypothetical protein